MFLRVEDTPSPIQQIGLEHQKEVNTPHGQSAQQFVMSAPPDSPPSQTPPRFPPVKEYIVISSPLEESLLFCNRWKCVYCDRTIWRQSRLLIRIDARGEHAVSNHRCHEKECNRLQNTRQQAEVIDAAEEGDDIRRRCDRQVILAVLLVVSVAISVTLGIILGLNAKRSSPPGSPTSVNSPSVNNPVLPPSSVSSPVTVASMQPIAPVSRQPTLNPALPPTLLPTPPPTWYPTITANPTTQSVVDQFLTGLPAYSLELATGNASSPQAKALDWLQRDPRYNEYQSVHRLNQRYALAVLYYSTNGDSWQNSTGWLTDESECDWTQPYFTSDEICRDNSHLSILYLPLNGLDGSVPVEIELLTDLGVSEWIGW
jgi:hypothetical protein